MTRTEQLLAWVPLMEAFKRGEIIQEFNANINKWIDIMNGEPLWNFFMKYRLKPQPKLVPFNKEYYVGKIIIEKEPIVLSDRTTYLIVCSTSNWVGIQSGCFMSIGYERLVEAFTFLDGSPTGKYLEV